VTKHLLLGEELLVWSDGYLWAASGRAVVTRDRIFSSILGGTVRDHPLAVDRKVTVADQVVDVELGGELWRFQRLHPEIAKERRASVPRGTWR
jgi:hypothetical protein